MKSTMKERRQRRHGAVLVGVLACLLVATVITALTVQSALRGRREARLDRQLAQTEWLCEGGILRAVQELRKSPAYAGETWRPELAIEPFGDAVVEIQVESLAAQGKGPDGTGNDKSETAEQVADSWKIRIVARLDSTTDSDGPMQRSRTLVLQPKPVSTEPTLETKSNSEKSE